MEKADSLPESAWKALEREPKYSVKTEERARPENVKERVVEERGYRNLRLVDEEVTEFRYSPTKCKREYRMVVLRKTIDVERGQQVLFTEYDYFFYITNVKRVLARQVVKSSNKRCNQENLIAQLKGLRALHSPVDTLTSNWAYMVMASLSTAAPNKNGGPPTRPETRAAGMPLRRATAQCYVSPPAVTPISSRNFRRPSVRRSEVSLVSGLVE